MSTIDDLPLFPLGLVLYPNEQVPLHIFEERYKDLMAFCTTHDVPFGIVLAHEGNLASVGCTAYIKRILKRYENGSADLIAEGDERFQIEEVYDDRASYYTADVTLLEDTSTAIDEATRERMITQHMKLLELAGRTVRPDLYQTDRRLSFVLAQNAGLSLEQKQEVLQLSNEIERVNYLVEHFERLIPQVEEQEDVQRRVKSNGHFKDFPPEHL
ncbi:MAG: LON peptidase substrate-binding domain-containing protein [Longimonas sp.]|uniref:LON peptidase substrate-binding domain-containing protein n=1 Tax=Longimonas sp. TaxID=2039626 RepID=UPI00335BFE8A